MLLAIDVTLNKKILALTLWASTPQNGQTHSKKLSAIAKELFESVWPFCGLAYEGLNKEY